MCDDPWVELINGKFYLIGNQVVSNLEASEYCERKGGVLTEISSKKDYQHILRELGDYQFNRNKIECICGLWKISRVCFNFLRQCLNLLAPCGLAKTQGPSTSHRLGGICMPQENPITLAAAFTSPGPTSTYGGTLLAQDESCPCASTWVTATHATKVKLKKIRRTLLSVCLRKMISFPIYSIRRWWCSKESQLHNW